MLMIDELPSEFEMDGKRLRITDRKAYDMPGSTLVPNNSLGFAFPDSVFLNGLDKVFEIHGLRISIAAFNDATPPAQISPAIAAVFEEVLYQYIRLRLWGEGRDPITKSNTLASVLVKRDTRTWEFRRPYYLLNGRQIQAECDNIVAANFTSGGVTIAQLRVDVTFFGALLTLDGEVPRGG